MKLTDLRSLDAEQRKLWTDKGYELPQFDRQRLISDTGAKPRWIHFGAGNIFRGFPAAALQKVLNKGLETTGIIVAEGFDYEIITKAYRPFDNMNLLVLLKSDGTIEKQVIGSITESLIADPGTPDWQRLETVFRDPGFQMASFTITEKGYSLKNPEGSLLGFVAQEIAQGPKAPVSMMGKLAALCLARFNAGAYPVALVSMDNCSHNGTKLKEGVTGIARGWLDNGFVPAEFVAYLENPDKVAFPWSMIDKITPRPDDSVKQMLESDGFTDTEIIVTGKKTWTAPFINAEEAEYLVIEDTFPNGRPALEHGGIIFTDRETVDKVERMKVCTCLNPLHTALAVFGCLLSHTKISEEMKDADLVSLIETLGFKEGLPVVTDPGIIRPEAFIKEVLEVRLPNPFLPDTPQRIACDTSQKIPIRFGQTILAYMERESMSVDSLKAIPLIIAGWLRYLTGIDDNGNGFELSPDPMLERLTAGLSKLSLGDKGPFDEILDPILSDANIFATNLTAVSIGNTVKAYFSRMIAEPGAVRRLLQEYGK